MIWELSAFAARASGIDEDMRRDHPHDLYDRLQYGVPIEDGGDVRVRLMVRAREVEQSFRVLTHVLDALPDTEAQGLPPTPRRSGGEASRRPAP